jgi:predicted nucleic acid-binding protein
MDDRSGFIGPEKGPGRSLLPKAHDVDDDKVLVAAVEGVAEYVVTGDQDILVPREYEQISVVTPRAFVGLIP